MLNAKVMSTLLGVVFVAVGIIGFIPNPLVSSSGIFVTNTVHNLVHLLTGGAFLVMRLFPGKESFLILCAGGAYGLIALLGFLTSGEYLLGMVHINLADRWLHAGLALGIIAIGLLSKNSRMPQAGASNRRQQASSI